MIDYASEILQKLKDAAYDAFLELNYPFACEDGNLPPDVEERLLNLEAHRKVTNADVEKDSLIATVVGNIEQAVAVVSVIERLLPEDAFRRAMAQIGLELSQQVEHLTDEDRRLQYEDVSYFIQEDKFWAAAAVAAAHVVATAARNFPVFDCKALADFIAAELGEGNCFMMADLYSIRAAAKECGMVATADNAT